MNRLTAFLQTVLIDLGTRCGTSTVRDFKTITERVEHESWSFLTITMPNFCKDFERSLDQGFVGHDLFLGFSRKGGLPRFLGGFLDLVFDRCSGRLLDVPSVDAILAVRQITLLFSKISLPCTERRNEAALQQYVETDEDVRRTVLHWDELRLESGSEPDFLSQFTRVGRVLWADYFSRVDSRVYHEGVVPRHGPGATADKLRGNAKYNVKLWTRRLEEVFPHWENLIPSESFLDRTDDVTILDPGDELAVNVILVPKTLKTPRIIAVEPTCMQYMQQGVLAVMVKEISRFDNTRNFVMFESQEPNQRLAREGSRIGALATLDLSEASDRVSNEHVRLLLDRFPHLRGAVDATRSRKAHVPGKGIVPLSKFASMGSALCFPFEAIVFATVIFCGIEDAIGRQLSQKDISSFRDKVRVYGDDIIVPVDYVQSVVEKLELHGFRVNSRKSFWTGKFRESCGKDWYDGYDVSVVKVRRHFPNNRQDTQELISTVELRNHLYEAGFVSAVAFLDDMIERLIPFPYTSSTSVLLGRRGTASQELRHDCDLHRPLVKGVQVMSKSPASTLDDYGALMKWFLKRSEKPFEDEDHLAYAGRPRSARIKTRWACPY